jgi:hypothetical protein
MLLAVALGLAIATAPAQVGALDLDGRRINPLQVPPGVEAVVLVFSSIDCPISNRYAPDLRRLHERFAQAGVRVWLVFPNPADGADAIGDHLKAFGYPVAGDSGGRHPPMGVLVDPGQDLVRLTKATVTPEAAVFTRRGVMVYRGRIDDRYADLGVDRGTPTTRDLEEAITATLAGRPVPIPTTPAVGCFIADFIR